MKLLGLPEALAAVEVPEGVHVSIEGMEEEILVVRLRLSTPASPTTLDDAIELWHRQHPWPTLQRMDGYVLAEVAGYYPEGITTEQVNTQINCALTTATAFGERLPK